VKWVLLSKLLEEIDTKRRIGRSFEVKLDHPAKYRYDFICTVQIQSAAELSQLVSHTFPHVAVEPPSLLLGFNVAAKSCSPAHFP
jgi:hypothetical protein